MIEKISNKILKLLSNDKQTDEEKEIAKEVVNNIYKFLRDEGFEKPIICDSANGWHLLYRQAMLNTAENTETMKKFLQVLDMFFSTEKVKETVKMLEKNITANWN